VTTKTVTEQLIAEGEAVLVKIYKGATREQIQAKTAEQDASLKRVGQKLATAHGTIGNLRKQRGVR